MTTNLKDLEIEEISILGKHSRPAVRAARIAVMKKDVAMTNDFETLVQAEMSKGVSRAIAGQRVLMKHGARPDAARVQKSQSVAANFMSEVDAVMIQKRCSRAAAMQEARRRQPDLFKTFQEA